MTMRMDLLSLFLFLISIWVGKVPVVNREIDVSWAAPVHQNYNVRQIDSFLKIVQTIRWSMDQKIEMMMDSRIELPSSFFIWPAGKLLKHQQIQRRKKNFKSIGWF